MGGEPVGPVIPLSTRLLVFGAADRSRGEVLASARAAGRENLAAVGRGEARLEAGLPGPLPLGALLRATDRLLAVGLDDQASRAAERGRHGRGNRQGNAWKEGE